jgi:hypothetical protein
VGRREESDRIYDYDVYNDLAGMNKTVLSSVAALSTPTLAACELVRGGLRGLSLQKHP